MAGEFERYQAACEAEGEAYSRFVTGRETRARWEMALHDRAVAFAAWRRTINTGSGGHVPPAPTTSTAQEG